MVVGIKSKCRRDGKKERLGGLRCSILSEK